VTIRTGLIGFGLAGRAFHAPLLAAEPRYELSAVVTSSPERAAAVRDEHPGARVIASADELFARAGDLDLVVVASTNETHVPLALRGVEAGLGVVVDKPLAPASADARALVEAAERAGTLLTVFQNRRWDGDVRTLAAAIARGDLGEVRRFESAFEWWKPQVGAGWRDTAGPATGGGILFDLGPHLIDQAIRLFGEVVEVRGELDIRRPGAGADDDAYVSLHHASGVRSQLWMSAVAPVMRPRFRVTGSRAVFRCEGLDPQEAHALAGRRPTDPGFGLHDDGRTAFLEEPDGSRTAVPLLPGDHLGFYRELADALEAGGAPPVDPRDAVRVLEIIEQVHRSTTTGRAGGGGTGQSG
jgi:predicted dehydrogenase